MKTIVKELTYHASVAGSTEATREKEFNKSISEFYEVPITEAGRKKDGKIQLWYHCMVLQMNLPFVRAAPLLRTELKLNVFMQSSKL